MAPADYRCPEDFEPFWQQSLAELQGITTGMDILNSKTLASGLKRYTLRFRSLEDVAIYGYALIWPGQARPLVIHTNGYDGCYRIERQWAKQKVNVLGFDSRGFGRSKAGVEVSPHGHILSGIEQPQTSILRGAVCDYIQAARVAQAWLGPAISNMLFYGFSFAGAMAIQAAAISQFPQQVVAGVPSFGNHALRLQMPIQGSGAEVQEYVKQHPQQKAQVLQTLAYFDTVFFAERLTAPLLVGIGQQDAVVPPQTVEAIVKAVQSPCQVRYFSHSHSDNDDTLWQPFIDEMLALAGAKSGLNSEQT